MDQGKALIDFVAVLVPLGSDKVNHFEQAARNLLMRRLHILMFRIGEMSAVEIAADLGCGVRGAKTIKAILDKNLEI